GSVFTFKELPEYYVEIILEWSGKDFKFIPTENIKHLSEDEECIEFGQELYLKYGIHRGKKGKILYIFPSSFIYESKEKTIEQIFNFLVTETRYSAIYNSLYSFDYGKLVEDKKTKKDKLKIERSTANTSKVYSKIKQMMLNNEIILYPKMTQYFTAILKNINRIDELVNSVKLKVKSEAKDKSEKNKANMLIKRIPIVVKIRQNGKESFFYENKFLFKTFENIEFTNSANVIKNISKTSCNIYTDKQAIVHPGGGFYYPFSIDKKNVKYNLDDDKNLFLLSREAYIDFMNGRTFLEIQHRFNFMGVRSFITATTFNDDVLKEFQSDIRESKSNLDSLINIIDKNISNRFDILLNFYFWEPAKTGGGKEIIEYVKDIIPSQLVQTVKLSSSLTEFYQKKFNRDKFQFNWQQHIYNIYHKDTHKKYRTSLFRQISLGNRVDLNRLIFIMNENMQYDINKKYTQGKRKGQYLYIPIVENLMFLNWLDKINKGEISRMSKDEQKQEFFEGKTYEERLSYFLSHGNLVKDSASMQVGVCIGLSLKILSWSINGYDKKTLAFVGKRIERNSISSLQAFVNEIFAKTKFHEYERLQSVNIRLSTNELLNLDDNSFNKDKFIFGLFLGSELYRNVKSEKDPEPQNNEEEATENEESSTGE
ncbi:MAG: hypothetical protein ACOC1P_06110, partial [Minisyncoccales bacterium]